MLRRDKDINIKIWVIDYVQRILDRHMLESRKLTCETCGCFVNPEMAIEGKSIIKTVKKSMSSCFQYPEYEEKYIFTPYFCKIHAPTEVK